METATAVAAAPKYRRVVVGDGGVSGSDGGSNRQRHSRR